MQFVCPAPSLPIPVTTLFVAVLLRLANGGHILRTIKGILRQAAANQSLKLNVGNDAEHHFTAQSFVCCFRSCLGAAVVGSAVCH